MVNLVGERMPAGARALGAVWGIAQDPGPGFLPRTAARAGGLGERPKRSHRPILRHWCHAGPGFERRNSHGMGPGNASGPH